MTRTKFYTCEVCHELRIAAHMIGSKCIYCPKDLPRLAPPPAPYVGHPDIRPPQDALDAMVRRVKEMT